MQAIEAKAIPLDKDALEVQVIGDLFKKRKNEVEHVLHIGLSEKPNPEIANQIIHRCRLHYNYISADEYLANKPTYIYDAVLTTHIYRKIFGNAGFVNQTEIVEKLSTKATRNLFMFEMRWKNSTCSSHGDFFQEMLRDIARVYKEAKMAPDPGLMLEASGTSWLPQAHMRRYFPNRPSGDYTEEIIDYCKDAKQVALEFRMNALADKLSLHIRVLASRLSAKTLKPIICVPPTIFGLYLDLPEDP